MPPFGRSSAGSAQVSRLDEAGQLGLARAEVGPAAGELEGCQRRRRELLAQLAQRFTGAGEPHSELLDAGVVADHHRRDRVTEIADELEQRVRRGGVERALETDVDI